MPDINKNADLVERLRSLASFIARGLTPHPSRAATLSEAADALEAQAAEIARLRDALERIAAHTNNTANAYTCAKIARAALQDGESGR